MNEESFIVKVKELLQISKKGQKDVELFDSDMSGYVIPMYQREYKWTEDKVRTFIRDINNRDKFLGNLILDKKGDMYEITDGQQRITTIMLILTAAFNCMARDNRELINHEQNFVLQYIMRDHRFVLKNDTVGEFLKLEKNQIKLDIAYATDVYFQKNIFENTYSVIMEELKAIQNIRSFIDKLLDCKLCLLICKDLGETESVEGIFLDMNFKLQKLDVEDIFKGYCFQNYRPCFHDDLKALWVELKQYSRIFLDWGYEDFSQFLYHYFLSGNEKNVITKNLTINGTGTHYLDGKDGVETEIILKDMRDYAKNLNVFGNNLKLTDYKFEDICPDAERYNTDEYIVLKEMCRDVIEITTVQYHKLPLLMLIYSLYQNDQLRQQLCYDILKRIITNYYIYAFLFISSRSRKKKESIDGTIFDALNNETITAAELKNTVVALRKRQMDSFEFPSIFAVDRFFVIYTIVDNYIAEQNFISELYSLNNGYNREHLIIPDNRKVEIEWWDENRCIGKFSLNDIDAIREYKKHSFNYLILEKELNRELGIKDIVTKVELIENHFATMPRHVEQILSWVENLPSFSTLHDLKGKRVEIEQIKTAYTKFIHEYFAEENKEKFVKLMEKKFRRSFWN